MSAMLLALPSFAAKMVCPEPAGIRNIVSGGFVDVAANCHSNKNDCGKYVVGVIYIDHIDENDPDSTMWVVTVGEFDSNDEAAFDAANELVMKAGAPEIEKHKTLAKVCVYHKDKERAEFIVAVPYNQVGRGIFKYSIKK